MSGDSTDTPDSAAAYAYRPSLVGAPWEFKLTGDGIDWTVGRRSGRVALRDVRRLRMSFKPANMQTQRYLTEIWAEGAPKLVIASSSWKSLVEQERLDRPYAAFIAELHRRIARAGVPARFERGSNALIYWPGLAIFVGMTIGLVALFVRALQVDAKTGAAMIGVFLLLFVWQAGNFFRRNRPGVYRPDALPAQVMPKQ